LAFFLVAMKVPPLAVSLAKGVRLGPVLESSPLLVVWASLMTQDIAAVAKKCQ
jgi:hypothetical protein